SGQPVTALRDTASLQSIRPLDCCRRNRHNHTDNFFLSTQKPVACRPGLLALLDRRFGSGSRHRSDRTSVGGGPIQLFGLPKLGGFSWRGATLLSQSFGPEAEWRALGGYRCSDSDHGYACLIDLEADGNLAKPGDDLDACPQA